MGFHPLGQLVTRITGSPSGGRCHWAQHWSTRAPVFIQDEAEVLAPSELVRRQGLLPSAPDMAYLSTASCSLETSPAWTLLVSPCSAQQSCVTIAVGRRPAAPGVRMHVLLRPFTHKRSCHAAPV